MWNVKIQKLLQLIFIMTTVGHAALSNAHTTGIAIMDLNGNVASFTGYAWATCFDDGNGPADYLEATVKDSSAPVENLLVSLQLIKGERAVSISDPVAGDANPSPVVILQGGNGVYLMLVNKTGAGARSFEVDYHCKTANGTHTGTDIKVNQFQ